MRKQQTEHGTKLWLSANDTYNWAHKPGAAWPCSFLSNRRLFAEFDRRGDLVDVAIDGGRGDQDCPGNELDAIVSDYLGSAHPIPAAVLVASHNSTHHGNLWHADCPLCREECPTAPAAHH